MVNQLHYHYVYFNTSYDKPWVVNKNEYNAICVRDLSDLQDVDVIQCPLQHKTVFTRIMFAVHNNKRIKLPFRKLWYPFYFHSGKFDKPYCFIVAGTNLSMEYLHYLKCRYPDCKLVKLHRDLMKVTYCNPEYSEKNMKEIFDLRMTFDRGEGVKYGFPVFDEIESKIELTQLNHYPQCDVFFAGRAKDRLAKIVTAYDVLTAAGLKCDFFITNVPADEQVEREGIIYSESFMPYLDMLSRSVNARCMLDINQDGAIGYTSRFLEAIIYNKKLIADNPAMLNSKYYDKRFIQYVEDFRDINPEFVNSNDEVDYHYDGDFSPIHLIEQIDKELLKINGGKEK